MRACARTAPENVREQQWAAATNGGQIRQINKSVDNSDALAERMFCGYVPAIALGMTMQILAVADSHDALVKALIARRHELGLSQVDMDHLTGLAGGFVAKIECGRKNMGKITLDCMLGALGLELALVPKRATRGAAVAT